MECDCPNTGILGWCGQILGQPSSLAHEWCYQFPGKKGNSFLFSCSLLTKGTDPRSHSIFEMLPSSITSQCRLTSPVDHHLTLSDQQQQLPAAMGVRLVLAANQSLVAIPPYQPQIRTSLFFERSLSAREVINKKPRFHSFLAL